MDAHCPHPAGKWSKFGPDNANNLLPCVDEVKSCPPGEFPYHHGTICMGCGFGQFKQGITVVSVRAGAPQQLLFVAACCGVVSRCAVAPLLLWCALPRTRDTLALSLTHPKLSTISLTRPLSTPLTLPGTPRWNNPTVVVQRDKSRHVRADHRHVPRWVRTRSCWCGRLRRAVEQVV